MMGLDRKCRGNFARLCAPALLLTTLLGDNASAAQPASLDLNERIQRFEAGLRSDIRGANEPRATWTLHQRMAHYKVPAVSVAVVDQGKLAWARAYGVADVESRTPVDANTVFSVGSVSKVAAALVTLRMVARGQLALDSDVNGYLKSWKIPASEHSTRPVTLRHILSHTSGLSVSGFPDFLPEEKLPSTIDTLNGTSPSKTPAVQLQFPPGSAMLYSGGGITVEQLLISDVSGQSFEEVAQREVLKPLGMSRSTYVNPLPASVGNIAKAHDRNGALVAKPRGYQSFPEMAASGLWTTPTDIAKLVIAMLESYRGAQGAFLPQSLATDMMSEIGPSIFGLGPRISGSGETLRFSHGGSNDSYKAWLEGQPHGGRGIVVFTNGANGEQLYQEVRRSVADAMGWPWYEAITEFRASDTVLDKIAGDYALETQVDATAKRIILLPGMRTAQITVSEQKQVNLALGTATFKLTRTGPLTFVAANSYFGTPYLMHLEFIRDASGAITGLVFQQDGNSWPATRQQGS